MTPRRLLIGTALVICGLSGTWFLARGPQAAPPRHAAASTGAAAESDGGASGATAGLSDSAIAQNVAETAVSPQSPFDAKRAFGYLLKVCRLGPRPSGTRAMAEQQKLISDHFVALGANVHFQSFDAPHPFTGNPVRMSNIIVSWNPQAKERVLLACHYDTRPFPDNDPTNPRGEFIGANDGASGVALLMELGHILPKLKTAYGVDFVLFDGEELVFQNRGRYFVGSEYFAADYARHKPQHRYVAGVLVDMIADKNLEIYEERNSVRLAPEVTRSVWDAAARVGVREFVPGVRHEIQDDHLALNQTAGIPTCDLIDFDYPFWHTMQDIPAQCSGDSLAKVGRVLLEWLERPGVKFK